MIQVRKKNRLIFFIVNDNLLILDLKSKIDTLSSEIEATLQSKNTFDRKKKELEKENEQLTIQNNSQKKLYNEIKGEFSIFEEKLMEFEERDAAQIQTVRQKFEILDF